MKRDRSGSFSWVSRDGKIIIAARGVRTFGQGFIAIILAVYLAKLGFSLAQIGAFISVGVAGSAFWVFLESFVATRVGRRRLLVVFTFMTAGAALGLVATNSFVLLLVFSFLGSLSSGAMATGPAQPLEMASLADAASPARRTNLFATYRIVATGAGAVGALAAGLPVLYQRAFGLSEVSAYKVMFLGFVLCLLLVVLLYALLSPAVEAGAKQEGLTNPFRLPSRRVIFTLAGLFSVDALAGTLVPQTLAAYWFNTKFGLQLSSLAPIFFFSQVLAATSLWAAARIAARIGLINTIVFTHIPSSLFLIAAAFAPTAWMAVMFWQLRAFFGQMDVPTRDSYTMAIVRPEERVAMASIHTVGRSVAGTVGPSAGTALWQAISASAPFVACAAIKIAYDLSLYFMFRKVRTPEEEERARSRSAIESREPAPGQAPEVSMR
ncbi:MAG: MFS transporter [Chloroflexi bacterium]|nr:MFS transporter [Chloroflexota bacterium]